MEPVEVVIKDRFKRIGFRFDVFAWWFASERMKIDLDEFEKQQAEDLFNNLLFAAHESYCRNRSRRNKYTFEKFIDRVNDMRYWQVQKLIALVSDISTAKQNEAEKKKPRPNGMI